MIDTIVFDVGKVLVDWNYSDYLDRLGFTPREKEAVTAAVFENPLWAALDGGNVTPDDALNGFFRSAPGFRPQIRRAFAGCEDTISLFPYSVDWISSLKKRGFRVLILSNYSEYLFEKTKHKMAFLPLMDGALFSFQCGMVKPQPQIYRKLIDSFHLTPEHTVFIDDRPENTGAAEAFGIRTICFTDFESVRKKLEELLACPGSSETRT